MLGIFFARLLLCSRLKRGGHDFHWRETQRAGRAPVRAVRCCVVAMSDDFTHIRMMWLDQIFNDSELSSTAKVVAFHISTHFNRKYFANSGVLYSYPSYETLAGKTNVSVRTMARAVEKLREREHIATTEGRGRSKSLRYHAVVQPIAVPVCVNEPVSMPDKTGHECHVIEKKPDIRDTKTGHLDVGKRDTSVIRTSLNNPLKNHSGGKRENNTAFQPFQVGWSLIVFYELSKGPGKLPRPGSTFMRDMIEVQKRPNMILAHQARHGWPEINRMFESPLALPASALVGRVGNIAWEMEPVVADSAKWIEWKNEFERRGWPFPSDANGMCFPCGGVKQLDTFMNEIARKPNGAAA